MTEAVMTVLLFNGIVMVLVGVILAARRLLTDTRPAELTIEGRGPVTVTRGTKLLPSLLDAGLIIPSGCGGKGTCGTCQVRVTGAIDEPLETEVAALGERALSNGIRLACQVTVRGDLEVAPLEGLPAAHVMRTRVRSSRHLTPLIKELILELPPDSEFDFRAGSFMQVTCPPYSLSLAECPIDARFEEDWRELGVYDLRVSSPDEVNRAYSLANHSGERGIIHLLVRLALPPPGAPPGAPPGLGSSYLFSLRPGDEVKVSGPFGHFVATESDREMVLVGGGVGMAPLRAHIFEQLKVLHTERKMSFWYGARSKRDLIYDDELDALEEAHPNFKWSIALSDPTPDDAWVGATGFIHAHLRDSYLKDHPAPAECEYYLCGPPLMLRATLSMLEAFDVPAERIFYDDFGA